MGCFRFQLSYPRSKLIQHSFKGSCLKALINFLWIDEDPLISKYLQPVQDLGFNVR